MQPSNARHLKTRSTDYERNRLYSEILKTHAEIARKDINEFIRFVMKDEVTGKPFAQPPIHQEMQKDFDEKFLLMWGFVESGKSSQVVGRILWDLGHNTEHERIAFLSATGHHESQAQRMLRTIKGYIENSVELRAVFPHLVPGNPWGDAALYIKGRSSKMNPSVRFLGAFNDFQGARVTKIVCDDLLDWRNTLTLHRMESLMSWFQATVLTRVVESGQVWILNNAWDSRDMMHTFEKRGGWKAVRYSIRKEDGTPRWPEQWSEERIQKKEEQLGPRESARQLHCIPRRSEDERFSREDIEYALFRGQGFTFLPSGIENSTVVVGVDLAIGKKSRRGKSKTVFVALAKTGEDVRILNIDSGNWTAPEIIAKIKDWEQRFGPVNVEDNAAQAYILEIIEEESIKNGTRPRVEGFKTGWNKIDLKFGVEALVGDVLSKKRLIIPCNNIKALDESLDVDDNIMQLLDDIRDYHPDEHTGDFLMAFWIALEALRKGKGARYNMTTFTPPKPVKNVNGVFVPPKWTR